MENGLKLVDDDFMDFDELINLFNQRQNAITKQKKIIASELIGEARVDQIYMSRGWMRLDVDGKPPGKQGKFDRVYEGPNGEIHVIEAKGGSAKFGVRTTMSGAVAQQGTKE